MGFAQGSALRDKIHQSLQTVYNLEAFRLLKPRFVPFGAFRWVAERKAARFLTEAFEHVPIDAEARLRGIAAGARIAWKSLALCCSLEAVLSDLTGTTHTALEAACSALAVTGAASALGAPILAHNFDYLPSIQPYYLIRHSHPAGKLRSVELAVDCAPGVVDGVNEAGLAITCNYAFATDRSHPAPTITMLIAQALSEQTRVDEAIHFFERTPRVGGGLLMLGDADGAIASLELSNTRVVRRDPEPGRDRLCHCNRYRCGLTGAVELPASASYADNAPAALRGRRVHQSSECRDDSLERRLHAAGPLSPEDVRELLADHGPDGIPSADTVCMHSDYWHTTASIQLFPVERRLRASFGPTCVAEYQAFEVGKQG